MKVLGISAFYHDSAAALVVDGNVVAAAQEERFTRIKHTADFPVHAIQYCLDFAQISLDDLDAVVFYDKPLLKFERLLQTYMAYAPRGLKSFVTAIPVWLDQKLFLRRLVHKSLRAVGPYNRKKCKLLFSEHHLSHAASAYYASPFDEAAILTIDGVGEWATATIGYGHGNRIERKKEMHFPHSIGLLYSAFTYFLGFRVNEGEYKLMGLASYGNTDKDRVRRYTKAVMTELIDIKEDGSLWMNQRYFAYATGLRMIRRKRWEKLFELKRRKAADPITNSHCDLAHVIQRVTEKIVLKMAKEARRLTGCSSICLAGGVALNCVANGKLLQEQLFEGVYIQPASGDAGGAVGAALAVSNMYFAQPNAEKPSAMPHAFLGPGFTDAEISTALQSVIHRAEWFTDFDDLIDHVTGALRNGAIVGWFQDRMEFGPRALGNRSILADPRRPDAQTRINKDVKRRESFRPFAPVVLEEDVSVYFDLHVKSPYMLIALPMRSEHRKPMTPDYRELDLQSKLAADRSIWPAATHVDFTSRIQTVSEKDNPKLYRLVRHFKQKTGCPALINTSFNTAGEPMVCKPQNAYTGFEKSEMDYLVIGQFVFTKETKHKLDQ